MVICTACHTATHSGSCLHCFTYYRQPTTFEKFQLLFDKHTASLIEIIANLDDDNDTQFQRCIANLGEFSLSIQQKQNLLHKCVHTASEHYSFAVCTYFFSDYESVHNGLAYFFTQNDTQSFTTLLRHFSNTDVSSCKKLLQLFFSANLISWCVENDNTQLYELLMSIEVQIDRELGDTEKRYIDIISGTEHPKWLAYIPFDNLCYDTLNTLLRVAILHNRKTVVSALVNRWQELYLPTSSHYQSATLCTFHPPSISYDNAIFLLLYAQENECAQQLIQQKISMEDVTFCWLLRTCIHYETMQNGAVSEKFTVKSRPILTGNEMKERLKSHYAENGVPYRTFVTKAEPSKCKYCIEGLAVCPNCHDDGTIRCHKCEGTGVRTCNSCSEGSVSISCPHCEKGYERCRHCETEQTNYDRLSLCEKCAGEGCSVCQMRGFVYAIMMQSVPQQNGYIKMSTYSFNNATNCYDILINEYSTICTTCAGTMKTACGHCQGTYSYSVFCSHCHGDYKRPCLCKNGRIKCHSKKCHHGRILCKKCKGKSYIYQLETIEKYIAKAPQLAQYFTIQLDTTNNDASLLHSDEKPFEQWTPQWASKFEGNYTPIYPFSSVSLWNDHITHLITQTEVENDIMNGILLFQLVCRYVYTFSDNTTLCIDVYPGSSLVKPHVVVHKQHTNAYSS